MPLLTQVRPRKYWKQFDDLNYEMMTRKAMQINLDIKIYSGIPSKRGSEWGKVLQVLNYPTQKLSLDEVK